jgi:stress response protein YsnF
MDINNTQDLERDLEQLLPYQSDSQLDYDYEESIRNIYRQFLAGDNYEIPTYDRDSYSYDHDSQCRRNLA